MKDPTCELALTLLCELYAGARSHGLEPDAALNEAVDTFDKLRQHVEARHERGRYRAHSVEARGAYPLPGGDDGR